MTVPAACFSRMELTRLASAALLLLVWHAAAGINPSVFPGPGTVLAVLVEEATGGPLFTHLLATLARVAAAMTAAMLLGSALGLAMGRIPLADAIATPWVKTFLNLPALIVMVLVYVWIGLNDTAAIMAVAIDKLPFVAITVRDGARALDPHYRDVSRVYRFSRWTHLRHVVLPQLAPYLMIALRNGLAVVWKLMLVAEFLGRPNGVGFMVQTSFQLFDVPRLMAYSLAFLACILLIDRALLLPLERQLNAWRQP